MKWIGLPGEKFFTGKEEGLSDIGLLVWLTATSDHLDKVLALDFILNWRGLRIRYTDF